MEDLEHRLEREARARQANIRLMIETSNHPERERLLADFDRDMREVDTGIKQAQGTWWALSPLQWRVLAIVGAGGYLLRQWGPPHWYDFYGWPEGIRKLCDVRTVRNLCARDLMVVDGGAFDPERKIVITERGSFVLRHGYTREMW